MPRIKINFGCFRFIITGKLRGGTKRTKTRTIGFGIYPTQMFIMNIINNFMNFTHVFGEFGIKLVI
jgi:hypothetical protein